jgi:hypothetical protein
VNFSHFSRDLKPERERGELDGAQQESQPHVHDAEFASAARR